MVEGGRWRAIVELKKTKIVWGSIETQNGGRKGRRYQPVVGLVNTKSRLKDFQRDYGLLKGGRT